MLEGSVPIDHKKDDQSKCEVHQKEHDAAGAVFFQLGLHSLAGSVSRCMARQKEAHHAKADIIRAERVEPEGTVVKSEPELKNSVQSIPRERAVKRRLL